MAQSVSGTAYLKPPDSFDFTRPEAWLTWRKRFDRYISVSNQHSRSEKEKIDLLCYTMEERAEEILMQILNSIGVSTCEMVLRKFDEYFSPKRNVIFERFKFNSRVQAGSESIDDYITALYTLAEICDYDTKRDELIRDRIVIGIFERKTSERLQLTADLTLEKAIAMARQAERHAKQVKIIRTDSNESSQVNRVKVYPKNMKGRPAEKIAAPGYQQRQNTICYRCGLQRHTGGKKCPAEKAECRICKRIGHWEQACKTKNVHQIEEADSQEEQGKDEFFLGTIDSKTNANTSFRIKIEIIDFAKEEEFLIDTGADVTCIPASSVPKEFKKTVTRPENMIYGPDGKQLHVRGCMNLNLKAKGKVQLVKTYIIEGLRTHILGRQAIRQFKLFKEINRIQMKNTIPIVKLDSVSDVEKQFPKIFQGLGNFKKELKIQLKSEAIPSAQMVPRVVAVPLLDKLKKELDKLVSQDVIVPVEVYTEWCSPIVCVPKGNEGEIRLCCDYRELNKNVYRAVFPIPKVDVTLARMKNAKFFTKLDAKAGFHQIKLSEESQPLTTFITPFGRYMFKRLPFRINCAPEYFSRMYSEILKEISNVLIHVDDVLIYAETKEKHDEILREVLGRLEKEGVTLNKEKCKFNVQSVEFLGNIVSTKGISISPERVVAISEFPAPLNKTSLLQFLGMVNFAGKYIPNRSQRLEPLNALLKDNVPFIWDDMQEKAFIEVKDLLKQAPTLAYYDHTKAIVVQADASNYGIGGVLIQGKDEERQVVAYTSRTLSPCEQKYSQIEKEALGLVSAAEKFKEYVTGIEITLETDHKPLLQILQTKPLDDLTPRLQRIRIRLMRYNYNVVYVPGKQLILADALSRNPRGKYEKQGEDLEVETIKYIRLIVENILKKAKDVNLGLLGYRTTPLENGYSPAELMFSRKIRSTVLMLPSSLGTFHSHEAVVHKEYERKEKQEDQYNRKHRTISLSKLKLRDKVWVIDMKRHGEVIQILREPNSYEIRTEKGIIRRNRCHLIPEYYNMGEIDDIEIDYTNIPVLENVRNGLEVDPGIQEQEIGNREPIEEQERRGRPNRARRNPVWMRDYV